MSERYAKLKQDWMLRGWSDQAKMLVNWRTSEQRALTNLADFYVAESCDGQTDFGSMAFLPQHLAMLELLIREGIAEDCPPGEVIAPWQRYREASNPRLTGIHWCVTGYCNMDCRHCYMEAPSGRYGQLPFEAMARLVEQFERANVLEISLTGGEPFMRRDLLDIIQLLADKKIRLTQIYSNGLLITDRHLEGIRKIGFTPAFQISFDGVGTHDVMRGTTGTEPAVIGAIRRLRAGGFPVAVATSIDKLNIGSVGQTYELMKSLDIQTWRLSAPQEMGNWRGTTTATLLDEQAEVCLPLEQRWLEDGRPFSIQLCGFFRGVRPRPSTAGLNGRAARSKTSNGSARPRSRRAATRHGRSSEFPNATEQQKQYTLDGYDCGTCREQLNLLPDGTLVPCPGYVDSILQDRMPNLMREELSQAWSHSLLRQLADMKKKDLLPHNPECATCELFKECGLGCRATALRKTGNLMARDPVTCELCEKGYKKRFQAAAAVQPDRTERPLRSIPLGGRDQKSGDGFMLSTFTRNAHRSADS